MKKINPKYDIKSMTVKELLNIGFRKYKDDNFVYKFPVYKYREKTLIYCEFVIFDDDMNMLHINTYDVNGDNFNYNEPEYGRSTVVEVVNSEIYNKLKKIEKEGLLVL